ncbi:hypothetical protein MtrunA17_Chr7g0243171 [Medicago truncatula]|nr:hypothetical protein MtrunA17_Chr7g0243171 [Medicago truncatula]
MYYNREFEAEQFVSYRFNGNITAYTNPPHVTSVEVFKLDTNKSPIGWKNVTLEDKVAFVSKCKSMVMSRDDLNHSEELVRGNSIYFAVTFPCPLFNPLRSFEVGMFCLNDSRVKYGPMETSKHGYVLYPLWFVPSLW